MLMKLTTGNISVHSAAAAMHQWDLKG